MSEHECFINSLVCTVWFVHLSSIKFLNRYYLMSTSYHNVISGYREYNITTFTQYDVIILIKS